MDPTYLPQRKTTTAPKQKAPQGACDCHFHIFGPADQYPYAEGRSYTPPDASTAEYLAMAQTLGLERMVVVQASVHGFDNRCTTDAVAQFGLDRARSVVMIPPDLPDADLHALHENGARGVRFITVAQGGATLDSLRDVAARIAPLGWHIQMYVPAQTWHDLADTILSLPVEVVLDHMGGLKANEPESSPGFQAVLRLLASGRCWIKLSGYRASVAGHPYADLQPLARRLVAARPDRCLWGTDWPHPDLHTHMPDDGALLDLLHDWVPDPAQRHAILVDNPARLYGFATVVRRPLQPGA